MNLRQTRDITCDKLATKFVPIGDIGRSAFRVYFVCISLVAEKIADTSANVRKRGVIYEERRGCF